MVAEVVLICGGHCLTFPVGSPRCSCQNLFLLTFSFRYLPAFLFVVFPLSLCLKCVGQKRKAALRHSYLFLQLSLWQVKQKPCVKSPLSSALHPSKVSKDLQLGNSITLLLQVPHRRMCSTLCLVICTRSCIACPVGNAGKITLLLRTLLLSHKRHCPPTQNNLTPPWQKAWRKRRVTRMPTAPGLLHLIWKSESTSSPPKILCCQSPEAKSQL